MLVERDNDLAIGVCLEGIWSGQLLSQDLLLESDVVLLDILFLCTNLVVVDLAVDSQSNALVLVQDGLCASVNANNGQTLVHKNSLVGRVVAAPIGATVLHLLAHAQGGWAKGLDIGMMVAGENATHLGRWRIVSGGVFISAREGVW